MNSFSIKGEGGNFLSITVTGYEYQSADNESDLNWLKGELALSIGAFSANYNLMLETYDLEELQKQLVSLNGSLAKKVSFSTTEEAISFEIQIGSTGLLDISGVAQDPRTGSAFKFKFISDQSFIKPILEQLCEVTSAFPIRVVASRSEN